MGYLLSVGLLLIFLYLAGYVGYLVGRGSQRPVVIAIYSSANASRKGELLETRLVTPPADSTAFWEHFDATR